MNRFLKSSRKKRRVLVVDDELINRELLETILSFNYDITTAPNGMEAMEILRGDPSGFSLILLDIIMPRMSGFDVIEACKSDEDLKNIPIMVMTSEKSAEVRSIHMGADDFIAKPYRMPEVIVARCERVIELNEEKKLIRSIEKDPVTKLYIKLFFESYVGVYAPNIKGATDAVAIRIDGLDGIDDPQERKTILRQIANHMKETVISTRGIGCRDGEDTILIYCRHKENYEELLKGISQKLAAIPGAAGIGLRAGVYVRPDLSVPIKEWFERAVEACDSVAKFGDTKTALYQ